MKKNTTTAQTTAQSQHRTIVCTNVDCPLKRGMAEIAETSDVSCCCIALLLRCLANGYDVEEVMKALMELVK